MTKTLLIDSLSGFSDFTYSPNGFDLSVAIDPDFPIIGNKASGQLYPVGYSEASSTALTSTPLWITTTPKDTKVYVYCSDGRFLSYDSSLGTETLIGTVPSSGGNGMAYYNNYIYLASNTNISRYGPLDGSPSLTNSWWTGLGLTALTDTTYPTIRGVEIPNHPMISINGKLFVCDVLNGQGILHKIATTKTTSQGDTNNNSAFNVLDAPFDFYPTSIAAYGTDVAVAGIPTSSSTSLIQGKAGILFWDTINPDTFYRQIPWDDPMITALANNNGRLITFSGNTVTGVRVSQYLGGEQYKEAGYIDDSMPPLQGAVDSIGSKLAFGGFTTTPSAGAVVYSVGSKNGNLELGLHNIAKTSSSGANPFVTALKAFQQDSFATPKFAIGWRDDSGYGIDKYSATATLASVFRKRFQIGRPFKVLRVFIPLGAAVTNNMTITPKIYVDDDSNSVTLPVINNTNYSGIRLVRQAPAIRGEINMMFQLEWSGTVPLPVTLPISILIELLD